MTKLGRLATGCVVFGAGRPCAAAVEFAAHAPLRLPPASPVQLPTTPAPPPRARRLTPAELWRAVQAALDARTGAPSTRGWRRARAGGAPALDELPRAPPRAASAPPRRRALWRLARRDARRCATAAAAVKAAKDGGGGGGGGDVVVVDDGLAALVGGPAAAAASAAAGL